MSIHPTKVALTIMSTATKTYPAIRLVTHDIHFHADIVNDRQIRQAHRLARDCGLELEVHPDLQGRVDRALSDLTNSDSSDRQQEEVNNGSLQDRYAIYCQSMKDLDQEPKSFDEWLNS